MLWVLGVGFKIGNPNFSFKSSMIMLTPNSPSNKISSTMFFPMCIWITAMWGFMANELTLEGGPWGWVGWLLGNTLENTYYLKLRVKCMSWPRVRVCLLLSNCWPISWSTSCFLIITPSWTKLVPIFNGLDDYCIDGWLLNVDSNVAFGAYIC